MMVDKFLERTLLYNAQMIEVVSRYRLILVDVLQSNVAELHGEMSAEIRDGPSVESRPSVG